MTVVSSDPTRFVFNTRLKFLAWQITDQEEPLDWVRDRLSAGEIEWHQHQTNKWISLAPERLLRHTLDKPSAESVIFGQVENDQGKLNDWLVLVDGEIMIIPDAFFTGTVITAHERMRRIMR